MKNNIFIMGDSYSTYGGYIPEGYAAYYFDGMEQISKQVAERLK